MSGTNQHIIPEHFLKPFIIPNSESWLWKFQIDRPSVAKVALKRAAAQDNYYSEESNDGSRTLDDLITDYENDKHKVVNKIRALNIGDPINSTEIAEIVVHLSTRSSHMREVMGESISALSAAVQEIVDSEFSDFFAKLSQNHIPARIYQALSENLEQSDSLRTIKVTRPTIISQLYFLMREHGQELFNQTLPQAAVILERIGINAQQISKDAQASSLQRAMAPDARVTQLSKFVWHVVLVPSGGAVLPDCTSIAFDGCDWKPFPFVSSEELKVVILPLTPDRLAVGKIDANQLVDVSSFNNHAAQAAYSFFLSSCKSEELEELVKNLGGKVHESINSMVGEVASAATREISKNYGPERELSEEEQSASTRSWGDAASRISCTVSLLDFGDKVLLESVAREIKAAISAFSKRLPISSIDGFTFALDYAAALKSLPRDFGANREFTPTENEEFVGVGQPVTVVVDGQIKTRGVLRGHIAANLISDSEEHVEDARSLIFDILAYGALTKLINNKFPEQMLKPAQDSHEAFLYGYASGVFEAYFCTSVSTLNERQAKGYEGLALSALRQALGRIPQKRKAYKYHGAGLNLFFGESASLIRNMLILFARMFGANKALGQTLSEESLFYKLLEKNELDRWMHLFQKDLEGFDIGLEAWSDFTEIFFTHRHFERLMTHFGIVVDRTDGPGAYIHVS